jgi:hypothetical protein
VLFYPFWLLIYFNQDLSFVLSKIYLDFGTLRSFLSMSYLKQNMFCIFGYITRFHFNHRHYYIYILSMPVKTRFMPDNAPLNNVFIYCVRLISVTPYHDNGFSYTNEVWQWDGLYLFLSSYFDLCIRRVSVMTFIGHSHSQKFGQIIIMSFGVSKQKGLHMKTNELGFYTCRIRN